VWRWARLVSAVLVLLEEWWVVTWLHGVVTRARRSSPVCLCSTARRGSSLCQRAEMRRRAVLEEGGKRAEKAEAFASPGA